MEDRCKEERCVQTSFVASLDKRIDYLENKISDQETRINMIEKVTAVSEEKVSMILGGLTEIKADIKRLGDKIDELERKPVKTWEELTKTILVVITTAIITFVLSKMLT